MICVKPGGDTHAPLAANAFSGYNTSQQERTWQQTSTSRPYASSAKFVPRHDTLFLKLNETPAQVLTGSAVACALQVLQAEDAPLEALQRVLARAVTCLEALPEEHQAEWRRAMHFLLLLIRHRRGPEEREELFEVITESVARPRREEVEAMRMTDAEWLAARGRIEMLLEQLEAKFGPVSPRVRAALEALPPQRLKEMARRLLTAQTLAELQLEA